MRHWKVAMPFVSALEWGSGKRPAATRLIVELRLANGQVGYGETMWDAVGHSTGQPLHALWSGAHRQQVQVALDESAYTLADVGNIVRAGAADVVLLDPHEIGGLWQTIKAAAVAESVGIPVTLHSGGELGFSPAAYVHLAASIPNLSIAIDCERAYLSGDVVHTPPPLQDGAFALPQGPGLGVTADLEHIARHAVDWIQGAYLDAARPGWFSTKPAY